MSSDRVENCRPHFYVEAVHNKAMSDLEGRPIYEDREMVKLIKPGERDNWIGSVDEPIDNPLGPFKISAKERFPDIYAAFKRGEQRAVVGTPLEMWPILTKSRVMELKAANIFSVEEYAAVQDGMLGKLGPQGREEREKAKAWLNSAKETAATSALASELATLKAQIAQLTGQVPTPTKEKTLEECSDAELKEYLKRETGQPVLGNPSRQTLLARVNEVISKTADAA